MILRGELLYDYFGKMATDNAKMESDDDDTDNDSDSDDDSFAEWFCNNQDKIPGVGTGDDHSYISKNRLFIYVVEPDGRTLYSETRYTNQTAYDMAVLHNYDPKTCD